MGSGLDAEGRGRRAAEWPRISTPTGDPAQQLPEWQDSLDRVETSKSWDWSKKLIDPVKWIRLDTPRAQVDAPSPLPAPGRTRGITKSQLLEWLSAWKKRILPTLTTWSKRARSLSAQMFLITTVLLANISLTIFANVHYPSSGAVGLIYRGTCDEVNTINAWLHVLISILSMLMLSASNYCMQLQVSPTRANLDEAHHAGDWLDIGLHTLRNLRYVRGWRRVSWAILAFTSLPISLL